MSDNRRRSHDQMEEEPEAPIRIIRVVAPRVAVSPVPSQPSESYEPSEDPEPSEDMGDSHPNLSRSPPPVPTPIPSPVHSPAHSPSPSPIPSPIPSPMPSPIPSPSPPSSPSPPPAPPAPIAPSSPTLPSLRFSSRNQGVTIRWDWMPISLRAWRNAEQIPRIPDPLHTPTLPLTGEPLHHSIPTMVARLRTHDEQLEDIERAMETAPPGVEELQQQVQGIEGDLSEIRDEVVDNHSQIHDAREEISLLRRQLAETQEHMRMMQREMDYLRARVDGASTSRG